MSIPFYGGINGQSFKITTIFNNYQELIADEALGWSSNNPVGGYYAINYGTPNSATYEANLALDGENKTATIWQKIYKEGNEKPHYELLYSALGEPGPAGGISIAFTEDDDGLYEATLSGEGGSDDSSSSIDLSNYVTKATLTNDYLTKTQVQNTYATINTVNNIKTIPSGGTTGQYLVKSSDTPYDVGWSAAPSGEGASIVIESSVKADSTNPVESQAIKAALDLKANNTTVEDLSTTVSNLSTTVNDKADKTTVTSLQTTVNSKADKTAVTSLETTVNNKADKTTVNQLQTTVNNIKQVPTGGTDGQVLTWNNNTASWATPVETITDLTNYYTKNEVDTALNNKANITDLPAGIPSGGANGAYLIKTGSNDYEVGWGTAPSGEGVTITVDTKLSNTSSNPVENQVIKSALDAKANITDLPTGIPSGGSAGQALIKNSNNDYDASWSTIPNSGTAITIDASLNNTSTNPVQNKVINNALASKADLANGLVPVSQIPDLDYVPTTRTINSNALSNDITLSASDVGAVPIARTINSKTLTSDITLNASDVGAVPTTRTVNGKALSSDITLSASDIGVSTVSVIRTTASLTTSGWSSSSPYSQTITVSGASDMTTKFVSVDLNLTAGQTNADAIAAWSEILKYGIGETSTQLTFFTATKPTVAVPIKVVVIG